MKKFSRVFLSFVLAGSVACASVPATNAQVLPELPVLPELSSQFQLPTLPTNDVPREVVALAANFGLTIPVASEMSSAWLPWTTDPTTEADARLVAATEAQLGREGHFANAEAKVIANEWATQAARGEVTFYGGVGTGNTHKEKGSGNIYELTDQQAQERLAWMDRDVETTPMEGQGFGVALSRVGGTVYLVEYFLN